MINKETFHKVKELSLIGIFLCFVSNSAHAGEFKMVAVEWPYALMGLAGGIVFLLYGLNKLTSAFKALAGEKLRFALSKLTKNKISSLLTGMAVTGIVQSSAATTVMVVGFISARLMTLPQSLGVILGADIGTTLTVQLIAFRLNQYALVAVALGYFIKIASTNERFWHIGRVIMAIGLIFFGIFMIGESMSMLQTLPWVQNMLTHVNNIFIGLAVGAALTAIMQSSAASLAIVIAFASQGLLSLEGALYLILGANVGTCMTAWVASIGARTDARRAAAAHITFKVVGTVLVLLMLPFVIDAIHWATGNNDNMAKGRHIANIHTAFNIMLALIFLPLTEKVAQWLTHVVPKQKRKELINVKFLDDKLIATPSLALNAARLESIHMSSRVKRMLKISHEYVIIGDTGDLGKIDKIEQEVDGLYRQIIAYLARVNKETLTNEEGEELIWLMGCANRLESISDLVGVDLKNIGRKRLEGSVRFSKPTCNLLGEVHEHIYEMYVHSLRMLEAEDASELPKNMPPKENFRTIYQKAVKHQTKRLSADEDNRVQAYSLEMDIIDKYQRIYYVSRKTSQKTFQFYAEKEGLEHEPVL